LKTARRYLAREIYRSAAVVVLALIGLFTFFSVVDQLDQVGRGSFKLYHLFWLEFLALPTRLYDLLPIGLLIGAILGLAGLAQRHELVILRVSGVSGMKLLRMLWLSSIPVLVGALLLAEFLTPLAELKLSEAKLALRGDAGRSNILRSGYWFRETNGAGGLRVINVGVLRGSQSAAIVTVYDFDQAQELKTLMLAQTATFESGKMQLQQVMINTLHPLGDPNDPITPDTKPVQVSSQATLDLSTTLTPELLLARVLTPERMSFLNLFEYIQYLSDNHLTAERQIVAVWRKLIYPFTLLVMIAIAAPLGFVQTRKGGVGAKVFVGILLGVGYFMLNQLSLNIGMLNKWPAWVTAIIPNALALSLALMALLLMENRNRLGLGMFRRKQAVLPERQAPT
jgi:lipopolysaccharide export system permease protein